MTDAQFAYAALYAFHDRWMAARRAVLAKRPRRQRDPGLGMMLALAASALQRRWRR